ncbi:hypothetical protein MUB04_15305 [Acinetobacter indicus]|uniref:hypothetical protein n=1 Tax=Acinetobacter TaxID=469 RepID=UPI0015D35BFA|nr:MULTISPECIES: hypothetical protein [Acinetobacter]MCP0917903.1 hypothetical protein [Acinetobacter indicus]
MNRHELIKVFIISLKAKGKMYAKKEPEKSSPTTFKDKYVQRLWEGYQLCYDHFFQDQPVVTNGNIQAPRSQAKFSKLSRQKDFTLSDDRKSPGNGTRLLAPDELTTVLINSTVSIIYRNKKQSDDQWTFKSAFMNLMDAVELINEMYLKGSINLEKWERSNSYSITQHFLIPIEGERKTHIWGDKDTLCRAWLNQSMNPKKYRLVAQVPLGKNAICSNCIAHINLNNLKANLRFDSENRLVEISPK